MKSWHLILMAIVPVLVSCNATGDGESPGQRPNVVVIYTDDMNFSDIGALGGKVLTPTIDSLVQQGIYFSSFYACSAVCSPSRYNLLTGRYASRSTSLLDQYPTSDPAFLRWNVDIKKGERTMAHVMKEAGYRTGMVGKYHNLQNETLQQHVPEDADPSEPEVSATIRANYNLLRDTVQKTSGFDYVEHIYVNNLHALDLPLSMRVHNMDWITEGALEFIEQAGDRPFFLYMPTTLPHDPAPMESMYADSRITPAGMLEKAPQVQPSRSDVIDRVISAGLPEASAPYTWLDDAVAALVTRLEEKGQLENTIILFASDHGGTRAKMTCYEEGVRAPAFLYWKGHFRGGTVIPDMVANIDIAPTVYELCDITPPEGELIDGRSWVPLLRGEKGDWRSSLLLEITYSRAVISDRWKYLAVRFPESVHLQFDEEQIKLLNQEGSMYSKNNPDGQLRARYHADKRYPGYFQRDQLYNMETDPREAYNLAGDTDCSRKLEEMKALLGTYVSTFPHSFGEFHTTSSH